MVNPVNFRPLPWLRELIEEMVSADASKTTTDVIHEVFKQHGEMKDEILKLKAKVRQLELGRPEPFPVKIQQNVSKPESIDLLAQIDCLVWKEKVPLAQCSNCQQHKLVKTCPKITS